MLDLPLADKEAVVLTRDQLVDAAQCRGPWKGMRCRGHSTIQGCRRLLGRSQPIKWPTNRGRRRPVTAWPCFNPAVLLANHSRPLTRPFQPGFFLYIDDLQISKPTMTLPSSSKHIVRETDGQTPRSMVMDTRDSR